MVSNSERQNPKRATRCAASLVLLLAAVGLGVLAGCSSQTAVTTALTSASPTVIPTQVPTPTRIPLSATGLSAVMLTGSDLTLGGTAPAERWVQCEAEDSSAKLKEKGFEILKSRDTRLVFGAACDAKTHEISVSQSVYVLPTERDAARLEQNLVMQESDFPPPPSPGRISVDTAMQGSVRIVTLEISLLPSIPPIRMVQLLSHSGETAVELGVSSEKPLITDDYLEPVMHFDKV